MDIFEMKKILDRKEKEKINLEGQVEAQLKSIESKYSCKTIASAKKKLGQMISELEEKGGQLDKMEEEIENKYPWSEV